MLCPSFWYFKLENSVLLKFLKFEAQKFGFVEAFEIWSSKIRFSWSVWSPTVSVYQYTPLMILLLFQLVYLYPQPTRAPARAEAQAGPGPEKCHPSPSRSEGLQLTSNQCKVFDKIARTPNVSYCCSHSQPRHMGWGGRGYQCVIFCRSPDNCFALHVCSLSTHGIKLGPFLRNVRPDFCYDCRNLDVALVPPCMCIQGASTPAIIPPPNICPYVQHSLINERLLISDYFCATPNSVVKRRTREGWEKFLPHWGNIIALRRRFIIG